MKEKKDGKGQKKRKSEERAVGGERQRGERS